MDSVYYNYKLDKNIKDNGQIIKKLDLDNIVGHMDVSIKETIRKEKEMEKEK